MCVWNGRGGACVPARTSAQRRFHTKIYLRITYHARGFNDGCALAGRHGRAHRHRPYPSPSCFSVQSTHNQQSLRPRSCKIIHHLEMNERQGPCTHRIPTESRVEIVVTPKTAKSRLFVYFCTAKTKFARNIGGTTCICKGTQYLRERYITRWMMWTYPLCSA